jgi:hypothetical protein
LTRQVESLYRKELPIFSWAEVYSNGLFSLWSFGKDTRVIYFTYGISTNLLFSTPTLTLLSVPGFDGHP